MPRARPMPPEERRAALIAATEPLLLEHGAQVSTKQIAAAAGVAEGTLFRVFGSLEELVDAAVSSLLDPSRVAGELRAIDPDDNLPTRMIAAVTVLQRRMDRLHTLFALLRPGRPRQAPTEEFIAERRRENQLLLDALAAVIEPDRRSLRASPMEVARLLQALTVSSRHPVLSPDLEHTDPAQVVDLLLHGVTNATTARPTSPCSPSAPYEAHRLSSEAMSTGGHRC